MNERSWTDGRFDKWHQVLVVTTITDFASKIALPLPKSGTAVATQLAAQERPLMMALNIPTYINLYGYGYRNVYELHELVNVNDRKIAFEGSILEQKAVPSVPAIAK